jgi:hypothetical protein
MEGDEQISAAVVAMESQKAVCEDAAREVVAERLPPRLVIPASNGKIIRRYGPDPAWMESILALLS